MKRWGLLLLVCACDLRTASHPVRPDDEDAWKGAPLIELEKHAVFSTLERQEKTFSDGSKQWVFQQCRAGYVECRTGSFGDAGAADRTCPPNAKIRCCQHQFTLGEGNTVAEYHARGDCLVSCQNRPAEAAKTCRY